MSDYTPEQFARLPKWAKDVVRQAEADQRAAGRQLAGARERHAAMDAAAENAARLALDPWGEERESWRGPVVAVREPYGTRTPVARERDEIGFMLDGTRRRSITISVRDGALLLTGHGPLVLRVHASNMIYVTNAGD